MKYYWIWSVVWTLCAFIGGLNDDFKKALACSSAVFFASFGMWVICYMY